eukprot:m.184435 g.184435  ORF g.184435 m.184435 type:complete len:329 (-) comp15391_c0_seq33:1484-2470(-)
MYHGFKKIQHVLFDLQKHWRVSCFGSLRVVFELCLGSSSRFAPSWGGERAESGTHGAKILKPGLIPTTSLCRTFAAGQLFGAACEFVYVECTSDRTGARQRGPVTHAVSNFFFALEPPPPTTATGAAAPSPQHHPPPRQRFYRIEKKVWQMTSSTSLYCVCVCRNFFSVLHHPGPHHSLLCSLPSSPLHFISHENKNKSLAEHLNTSGFVVSGKSRLSKFDDSSCCDASFLHPSGMRCIKTSYIQPHNLIRVHSRGISQRAGSVSLDAGGQVSRLPLASPCNTTRHHTGISKRRRQHGHECSSVPFVCRCLRWRPHDKKLYFKTRIHL